MKNFLQLALFLLLTLPLPAQTINLLGGQTPDAQKYLPPHISGVSILVKWSEVEGTEGKYDFSGPDAKLKFWSDAHKTINLIIWVTSDTLTGPFGNDATPPYLWNELGPKNYTTCNTQRMPNYLSGVWIIREQAFLTALSAHYSNKVGYIRVGVHGGESTPAPTWNNPWTSCGRAYSRWGIDLLHWEEYMRTRLAFQSTLKGIQWMVSITPAGKPLNTFPDYLAGIAAEYGIGFGTQGYSIKDLGGNCVADWCALFVKYPSVPHEIQFLTPCPGSGCTATQFPALIAFAKKHSGPKLILELFSENLCAAYCPGAPGYPEYHTIYSAALEN